MRGLPLLNEAIQAEASCSRDSQTYNIWDTILLLCGKGTVIWNSVPRTRYDDDKEHCMELIELHINMLFLY